MKGEMAFMDQIEIANFLAQELLFQQFLNFEGYSGVPTRTTPTLTPTTLRNIEQTFIELQSETESHENEAGFVPPLVHPIGNNQYIPASEADVYNKSALWQPSLSQSSSSDSSTRPTPPVTPKSSPLGGGGGSGGSSGTPAPQGRRNMGGRKPAKELHLSPEEEERRRIRRERNKAAAARCRKRRVDHTNSLVEEVDRLEQKKQELQDELKRFQQQKDELELFLESHANSSRCYLGRATPPDVKPYGGAPLAPHERVKTECSDLDDDCFPPPPKRPMLGQGTALARPPRPRTLDVHRIRASHDLPGISIATPSAGIQFNFDSLMVGGTGLTPVSAPLAPTCSTQIRIPPVSSADMTSPDSCGPPKLVSL